MIITWIVGLLSAVFIVGVAIIGLPVIRANLPGASRRERALRMAGRLALPAPVKQASDLESAAESLAFAVSRGLRCSDARWDAEAGAWRLPDGALIAAREAPR